jgi:YidC/Oxa1 family membrane protein insertase
MTMSAQNTSPRSNVIIIMIGLLAFLVWMWAGNYFWPSKPKPAGEEAAQQDKSQEKEQAAAPKEKPPKQPQKPAAEEHVNPEDQKVVTLGGPDSHLTVKLNPRGAGVLQLVANHFQAADPKTGEPEWLDAGRKVKKPLELIPEDKNREIASFLFYHYADPKGEDFPLDTLGQRVWKRIAPENVVEGEPVNEAVFQTEVQGVRITKTYWLEPGWYHIGLAIKLELIDPEVKEKPFRYQFTGPHGLPIEGQWYATVYRNCLIGRWDNNKGDLDRNYQDQRTIAHKEGGDEVTRTPDQALRYAVIQNQFFASGIAVATKDRDGLEIPNRDFLGQARPMLMEGAVKGIVRKAENDDEVWLEATDRKKHTFEYASAASRTRFEDRLHAGAEVIVVHRPVVNRAGKSREIITDVLDPNQTAPIFHDDISVAVSTPKDDRVIRLKQGEPVVHQYVLYSGPMKARLLDDHLFGQAPAVDPTLVNYYLNDLHLDTLTDYRNPGVLSDIMSYTPWTRVVIWFTNRMHDILWFLYCVLQYFTPNVIVKGLCILLLTVMVRGAMHPVSRKQARMTMKMQQLKPELDKLKEKYKDDRQQLGMAQMELYRRHGINPMGSCWLMLLQMPVFLGLYYCLQESIHFRLNPFLWMKSLTAPDMLIHWGDRIPFISTWENYGAFYWLGPYLNVLPVIAVALMILQQKYMMPPAADEQQAMQQKLMKYMMIFFGLMFYKVAAGLCLNFIASSAWGFAERKLLPKKKPGELPPPVPAGRPTLMQRLLQRLQNAQQAQQGRANGVTARPATAAPPPAGGGKRKRGRPAVVEEDGIMAKLRAKWADLIKKAEKR